MSGSIDAPVHRFDQQWRPSFYASQSCPGFGGRISRNLGLKLRFGSTTVIPPVCVRLSRENRPMDPVTEGPSYASLIPRAGQSSPIKAVIKEIG